MPNITAAEVREVTFSYSLKGYDMSEVDAFLERLADEMDHVCERISWLEEELEDLTFGNDINPKHSAVAKSTFSASEVAALKAQIADQEAVIADLKGKLDSKLADEEVLSRVLVVAQRTADDIVEKADIRAAATIQEACVEAQRILASANAEHQETLNSIHQLKAQRDAERAEFAKLIETYIDRATKALADIGPSSARKASVEKPWLKYYPESLRHFEYSPTTLREFLCASNQQHDDPVISYYGYTFSLRSLLANADAAAASLASLGVREGSKITMFIRAVPEFLFVLLAAEKLGAVLVCRDNSDEENLEAIVNAESDIAFVPEYLPQDTEKLYYDNSQLKHLVLVSPYTYANADDIPDYVASSIEKLYEGDLACDSRNIAWDDFMSLGENYTDNYEAPRNPERSLYHSYTSGSTGPSKEVMHSAATMCGFLSQLVIPTSDASRFKISCLLTLLPPALVAVVNPMLLYNIASGNLLILSPFCEFEDIDLEFMRHRPNQFIAVPMMAGYLKESKRIPEDFSMDFLYVIGGGADPVHNKWLKEMQAFLEERHSPAVFSMCYGLSEAGAAVANPHRNSTYFNCGSGIPMRGTTVGIFERNTWNELPYGEIGEICVTGPSCMMGYADPVSTAQTVIMHDDGLKWVHSGDFGYMSEEGELFVLGRNLCQRYGGGPLFTTVMENKICELEGLKDCFFVIAADKRHEGCFLPYLYLVLEDGVTVDDVEPDIRASLDSHEQPVRITLVPRREFFHFKTNRRILAAQIDAEGR